MARPYREGGLEEGLGVLCGEGDEGGEREI